jgi:hypothetical protein
MIELSFGINSGIKAGQPTRRPQTYPMKRLPYGGFTTGCYSMDHNRLDEILRRRGWYYDNGWTHDAAHWDCYVDDNYGRYPYFVILVKAGNGRLLKLGEGRSEKEEVWAGPISNENDIDILMSFIAAARD